MSENLVWIRNSICRESEAKVNVLSGMAQFGLNVFEGIRCYESTKKSGLFAFRLNDHLERLANSCKLIGLELPASFSEIQKNICMIISKNKLNSDLAIRLTVFADEEGSWNSIDPVSYFIAPMAKPRTDLEKLVGLRASVSSWCRISDNIMPARAKVGANYINSRFAYLQVQAAGYDFPILLNNQGFLSEGSGACIFLVKENTLVTPSKTSSILESITRDTIIELANSMGLSVEERMVNRTELYLADEIFMCGTAAEIIPIVSVDQYAIGNGSVGEHSRTLLAKYHNVVSGEIDRYANWLTPII